MNRLLKKYFILLFLPIGSCDGGHPYGGPEFPDGEFSVSPTEVALLNDEPQTITVCGGEKPTVSSEATWLYISEVTAPDVPYRFTFTINADVNPDYDVRKATVSVTAGSNHASVEVSQFGAQSVEIITPASEGKLNPNGGTFTLRYNSTSEVGITAPSWLTPVGGKALTQGETTYSYGPNTTGAVRGGDFLVILKSTPSISATFAVEQATSESGE